MIKEEIVSYDAQVPVFSSQQNALIFGTRVCAKMEVDEIVQAEKLTKKIFSSMLVDRPFFCNDVIFGGNVSGQAVLALKHEILINTPPTQVFLHSIVDYDFESDGSVLCKNGYRIQSKDVAFGQSQFSMFQRGCFDSHLACNTFKMFAVLSDMCMSGEMCREQRVVLCVLCLLLVSPFLSTLNCKRTNVIDALVRFGSSSMAGISGLSDLCKKIRFRKFSDIKYHNVTHEKVKVKEDVYKYCARVLAEKDLRLVKSGVRPGRRDLLPFLDSDKCYIIHGFLGLKVITTMCISWILSKPVIPKHVAVSFQIFCDFAEDEYWVSFAKYKSAVSKANMIRIAKRNGDEIMHSVVNSFLSDEAVHRYFVLLESMNDDDYEFCCSVGYFQRLSFFGYPHAPLQYLIPHQPLKRDLLLTERVSVGDYDVIDRMVVELSKTLSEIDLNKGYPQWKMMKQTSSGDARLTFSATVARERDKDRSKVRVVIKQKMFVVPMLALSEREWEEWASQCHTERNAPKLLRRDDVGKAIHRFVYAVSISILPSGS